ncbi:YqiA/YcfP family alpha/beta fold hydrolase [uncultured Comamonas sp.]|uniref:YqiA/YcfP family alpha/beta fold hydrolase n=1 Tax=uncultured Comamonas sp. TaxID=114710 RepID=UPI003748D07C
MTTTHLLYLHGFRSSPQSAKAQRLQRHIADTRPHVVWCAPQLPPSPRQAADLLLETTRSWAGLPPESLAVVGSSLGGFYASWVAQQLRCKSVMINPSTTPWVTLEQHLGEQTAWHKPEESFFFRPEYLDELQALNVGGQPPAAAQLLIAAMGDEVLHWQDMVARYPAAQLLLDEGSDHALSNFESYLPQIDKFLGW